MKTFTLLLFALFLCNYSFAQQGARPDTLPDVIVTAFASHTELINTPVPIDVVRKRDLERFDNTYPLNAINMMPGVSMDQRSPGSYRLNFRGSTVRSPFGVRNVKVYYNDIPITDPGGETPLQVLGNYNYGSIQILKGPSGSMYGSGIGGVMMISDFETDRKNKVAYSYGSFNTQSMLAEANFFDSSSQGFAVKYNRQSSDGDRNHTRMHRDVVSLHSVMKNNEKQRLSGTFLYSDLYYQTPGALTLKEYKTDPKQARPATPAFPSAEGAKAERTVNYLLSGLTYEQNFSRRFNNKITGFVTYMRERNPTFRNYTKAETGSLGLTTDFGYNNLIGNAKLNIDFGGEYQHNFNSTRISTNENGEAVILNTNDEMKITSSIGYLQARLGWDNGFSVMAGASVNAYTIDYSHQDNGTEHFRRNFKTRVVPRLSIMQSIQKNISVYALVSSGFNPPSSSEVLPTSYVFNRTLQAERGLNFEVGSKLSLINRKLFIDFSAFSNEMRDIIVQHQDNTGGGFYTNEGSAEQKGLEMMIDYHLLSVPNNTFKDILFNLSTTLYRFRYKSYKPLNDDFTGNKLPGVSPVKLAASIDLIFIGDWRLVLTGLYSGKVAVNDANTELASSYFLLGAKLMKSVRLSGLRMNLSAGGQNLTDEVYSLGNDINAAAGRYYNVAAGRSFYGGIELSF